MVNTYFSNLRDELKELVPASATKVLEVGCGDGSFRASCPASVEYWGVEPVAVAAEKAQNVLDKVFLGSFDDVYSQLPEAYFDLIICNDVIEHLTSHDDFLKKIKAKMVAQASIIGSVPNVRYAKNLVELLFAKDWRYRDSGVLDATHLRFFTETSLRRTLLENDYEIIRLFGIRPIKKSLFPLKRLRENALILLLGKDCRFMQLAFAVRILER